MSEKLRKVPKDKETGIAKKYVPKGLSKADKAKQVKSIKEGTDRPKLKSAPDSKRSKHVVAFEKKYGKKISDTGFITKNIISATGRSQIIKKGLGAYRSGGSRPNTSAQQWALARLASVIMGGKARQVDKKIWDKYKISK